MSFKGRDNEWVEFTDIPGGKTALEQIRDEDAAASERMRRAGIGCDNFWLPVPHRTDPTKWAAKVKRRDIRFLTPPLQSRVRKQGFLMDEGYFKRVRRDGSEITQPLTASTTSVPREVVASLKAHPVRWAAGAGAAGYAAWEIAQWFVS